MISTDNVRLDKLAELTRQEKDLLELRSVMTEFLVKCEMMLADDPKLVRWLLAELAQDSDWLPICHDLEKVITKIITEE